MVSNLVVEIAIYNFDLFHTTLLSIPSCSRPLLPHHLLRKVAGWEEIVAKVA